MGTARGARRQRGPIPIPVRRRRGERCLALPCPVRGRCQRRRPGAFGPLVRSRVAAGSGAAERAGAPFASPPRNAGRLRSGSGDAAAAAAARRLLSRCEGRGGAAAGRGGGMAPTLLQKLFNKRGGGAAAPHGQAPGEGPAFR